MTVQIPVPPAQGRLPCPLLMSARCTQHDLCWRSSPLRLLTVPLNHGAPAPGALLDLAATLYDSQQISLRRAAEIDGLGSADMMDELGRCGTATLRLRRGELERELAAFGS